MLMIKNNFKTILFASLIVAMILPFSAMNLADAAPNENVNEKGKLYLKDTKNNKTDDVNELNKLHEIIENDNSSEADKKKSSKRMNEIKQQFENQGKKISDEKRNEIRSQIDIVSFVVDEIIKNDKIHIVAIGTDFENQAIKISIDREGLTDKKIEFVEKKIRKAIDDDADITIVYADPIVFTSCSQTSDCNPMQGGVKIIAEGATHCSMGYKATYDEKIGFVTAGHCMQNTSSGQKVYNYNNWWEDDLLGSVIKNTLSYGTSCDCAFVEETEADESISNKVYNDITLSGTYFPTEYTYVVLKGYVSGTSYLGITDSYTVIYPSFDGGQTTVKIIGAVETNGYASLGDSGGTVYEAWGSTPSFAGIFTATMSQSSTPSYYTPYYNIQNNFSGITFG